MHSYEQIVVTPSCPGIDTANTQLNEDNDDFSQRRRYHHSSPIERHFMDDI